MAFLGTSEVSAHAPAANYYRAHFCSAKFFPNISGVGVKPITPLIYDPAWLDNFTAWSGLLLESAFRVAVDGKSGEDEVVIQTANTRVKND